MTGTSEPPHPPQASDPAHPPAPAAAPGPDPLPGAAAAPGPDAPPGAAAAPGPDAPPGGPDAAAPSAVAAPLLAAPREDALAGAIDAVLRTAVERGDIPGVAATAGNAAGTLYEGGFGTRGLDQDGAPMAPDTVVWIASMTKAVTTVAAMRLVEAGRLALDAPIAEVLPRLAEAQVLEGWAEDGSPRLRPPARPVTLRDLLTHTSGFSYDTWNADIARYQAHAGLPPVGTCRLKALETPLVADPGTRWEYGIGIDHVGLAVEAVTGRRLGHVIAAEITGPLGMADTAFRIGPKQRPRLASMHRRDAATGALSAMPFELPQEPEFHMGGGGLYGTVRDYLRFCRMLLNGGTLDGARILKPETVAEMRRDQIAPLEVRPMRSASPGATHDVDLFPGMRKGWGLSFLINAEEGPDGRAAGSLAWAGLGNTYYWIDPARDRAGVLATQLLPFGDPKVLALLGAFERAVYAGPG